jgi:ubiquinone/menaquinone biosynthesis C-methylase UbiE
LRRVLGRRFPDEYHDRASPSGSAFGDAPTLAVMSSTKRSTRRWFDRRAGNYESGFTSRWRDPVQRESLAALDLTSSDRVLDVGCGTGAASRAAAATAASVVGIDLSPQMIQQAVGLADGMENVDFEVADAEQLPFGAQEFTSVLCSNSFHHYPDPLQATREMARVLAPGGRLVIGDACADLATARIADRFLRLLEPGHVRLYRSAELGSFLRGAGLTHVMLRKLANGGFAIVRGVAAA